MGRRRRRRAVERTRIGLWSLFGEVVGGIRARPVRAALTALGTILGVGAFVAVKGLSSTASAQVSDRFDMLRATEVRLEDTRTPADAPLFTPEAEQRMQRLNGVEKAGYLWSLDPMLVNVSSQGGDPAAATRSSTKVLATSPGFFDAAAAQVRAGRLYDRGHNQRGDQVAVLGTVAAERLGVVRVESQPAIFVNGDAYTVVGIIDGVERHEELLTSVMIPPGTAVDRAPELATDAQALLEVAPGAAGLIGQQAPLAVAPHDPDRVTALVPPDPASLRDQIEGDVEGALFALAAVALFIGVVAIANTTLVAVLERTGEIGLRRALGASRTHIALQFVAEAAALGALGGLIGTSLGILSVTAVGVARDWTTVISPTLPLVAPLLGMAAGGVAGLYPAAKAANTEPADALRAG